jgi:hypothetical protein
MWAQEVPTYRAGRTIDPIRVDGKLDEFTWAMLPRVGRFQTIRGVKATPQHATNAAVAWDDQNLYVSFVCRDKDPWATMKTRDDRLWEEEVVEVFLDPDGDGKNYPELEVSPNNVVVDLLIPAPRSGVKGAAKWDIAGLQTAVARHSGGWTVEIAIPWKSLAAAGVSTAPKAGDRWRVGLYRIKRPGGPGKETGQEEFLAWSPTRGDRGFHDPERFGVVEFVDLP